MKIKTVAILFVAELLTLSILGELGITSNSMNPIIKCLLIWIGVATLCILLHLLSCHEKATPKQKVILRFISAVFIFCSALGTIAEFLK